MSSIIELNTSTNTYEEPESQPESNKIHAKPVWVIMATAGQGTGFIEVPYDIQPDENGLPTAVPNEQQALGMIMMNPQITKAVIFQGISAEKPQSNIILPSMGMSNLKL